MPATETWQKRHIAPAVFGRPYAHPCLGQGGFCPNTLTTEDVPLEEGMILMCLRCLAKHEFYVEYAVGAGGALKYGVIRLLEGEHVRDRGEPLITEFLED